MHEIQTQAPPAALGIPCQLVPSEMVKHLGQVCRELRAGTHPLREGARVKLIRVAYVLDKSEATMSRFERGEVQPASVDNVVNAYADELGLEAFDIWVAALNRWQERGPEEAKRPAPLLPPPTRRAPKKS